MNNNENYLDQVTIDTSSTPGGVSFTVNDPIQEAYYPQYGEAQERMDMVKDQMLQGVEPNEEYTEHNEQYEPDEKEVQPRKRKRKDKRFDEFTYKLHAKDELLKERELELKRMRDEHVALQLQLKQREIKEGIDKVTNIMLQAQEEDDNKTYVESTKLMSKLTAKEAENERLYAELQEQYKQYEQEPSDYQKQHHQWVNEVYRKQSDPRDLKSEHYSDFLNEHTFFNPESEDYDDELSSEMLSIKKKFNRELKLDRRSNYIGTPEYYEELSEMFYDEVNNNQPKQKQTRNQRQNSHYEEEDDMAHYVTNIDENYHEQYMRDDGRPNVTFSNPNQTRSAARPVYEPLPPTGPQSHYNNDGYYHKPRGYQQPVYPQMPRSNPNVSPGYRGAQGRPPEQLPELDANSYRMAIQSDMRDPANPSRKLQPHEKVQRWREQTAQGNWQRGGR